MRSMGNDNAETSLVFHVLYTCGKKAAVVKNAATKPIISIMSILFDNLFKWIPAKAEIKTRHCEERSNLMMCT